MYATVKAPEANGAAVPAMWEAELAQGALDEMLPRKDGKNTADAIGGSTIMLDTGAGSLTQIGGGAGDVVPGQNFHAQATRQSDAQIVSNIDATLEQFNLKPLAVRVLRPLGPAPSVIAQVDHPSTLAGKWGALTQALNNGDYEGLYLEIQAADGTVLVRGASALRVGAGTVWFAPDMDSEFGILHSGLGSPGPVVDEPAVP